MVGVTKVKAHDRCVDVGFLTCGIPISTRVCNADTLTPQQIVEKAYASIKPLVVRECLRQGIPQDHVLPQVSDEIERIELLGVNDVNFVEGQQPIKQPLRCTGHTRFGKVVDLRDRAVFMLESAGGGAVISGNMMLISPAGSATVAVSAAYGGMTSVKSFRINYTTQG
jgi:hypothetical protein